MRGRGCEGEGARARVRGRGCEGEGARARVRVAGAAVCGGQLTTLGVCGIASRSRSASLIAPARTQAERVTFQCLSEGGRPALG